MFGVGIPVMRQKDVDSFKISDIEYSFSIFECDKCNAYSMTETHEHVYLRSSTLPEQPRKHQGQQTMFGFKSSDEDIDCVKGDETGYCSCNPFWYNNSAEKREATLKEYGVEWDPTINF